MAELLQIPPPSVPPPWEDKEAANTQTLALRPQRPREWQLAPARSFKAILSWAVRSPLLWLPLLAGIGVAGASVSVALRRWPEGWEPAQQAVLAAAIAGEVGALLGLVWSTTFQELQAVGAHRRDVRGKLLQRFLDNNTAYYSQLAAVSGELAAGLDGIAQYPGSEEHVKFGFYHAARYLELFAALRSRFQHLVATDYTPGLVLRSSEAEDRLWKLELDFSSFGYDTSEEQFAVIDHLRVTEGSEGKRRLASPAEFLHARDRDKSLLAAWGSFNEAAQDRNRMSAMAKVLYTFNALLDYEDARVIEAWYEKGPAYPTAKIREARAFFASSSVSTDDLRVTLPP